MQLRAFILSRRLDTLIKHEARVVDMSHTALLLLRLKKNVQERERDYRSVLMGVQLTAYGEVSITFFIYLCCVTYAQQFSYLHIGM